MVFDRLVASRNIGASNFNLNIMNKVIKTGLLILGGALLVLQFFQIDKTNPPLEDAQDYLAVATPPAGVTSLLQAACYDCHSHVTRYPWYTNIQPVAWWIKDHIEEGRQHLNFSVWATYPPKKAAHKLEECFEMVESKEMPMKSYTWMHGNARLTTEERSALAVWFREEYRRYEQKEGEATGKNEVEKEEREEGASESTEE
jgi:hypothetical protein